MSEVYPTAAQKLAFASKPPKRGKSISTKQQKIDWLLAHEDLWRGHPRDTPGDLDNEESEGHAKCERRMLRVMQKAGLFSHSTESCSVAWDRLIAAARKQRREKQ